MLIYTSVYRLQFWCLLGVIILPITKDSEKYEEDFGEAQVD